MAPLEKDTAKPTEKPKPASSDQRLIDHGALEKLRLTVIDLFAQGMFHQVGMREIAKRAKVGLATIYKYFGNKEELVFACIHQDLANLSEKLKAAHELTQADTAASQLQASLDTLIEFYLTHRQIAEIVYLNIPTRLWVSETHPMQVQQINMMKALMIKGQSKGEIRTDQDSEAMAQLLLGAIFRYIVAYLLNQLPQKQPAEVSKEIFNCLWPMLRASEAAK